MHTNLTKANAKKGIYSLGSGKGHHEGLKRNSRYQASTKASFCPPFAMNDAQLRTVLLHRAWKSAHGVAAIPENCNYEAVNQDATARACAGNDISKRAPEKQHQICEDHTAAVKRAGGYMQLQAAIAWKSWRLQMPSVDVARSLSVSPWMVRKSLHRLRATAAELGFDVGRMHGSARPEAVGSEYRKIAPAARQDALSLVAFQ